MASKHGPPAPTISGHVWLVPSVGRAFEGWLEGRPTNEQRQQREEEVRQERLAWRPSDEAYQLVEQLKALIGYRIRIQFWDPIMFVLDEEGPFPFEADCLDVVILHDGEFPQAYIQIGNGKELPNRDGYSPANFIEHREESKIYLAPVAEVHNVTLASDATTKC